MTIAEMFLDVLMKARAQRWQAPRGGATDWLYLYAVLGDGIFTPE